MSVEVASNSPLAEALNEAINSKIVEIGWGQSAGEDSALSEYIVLMLVNGKSQDQIATELASDLLSLPPDDPIPNQFAGWLFEQVNNLNAQLNGAPTQPANVAAGADDINVGDQDTAMDFAGDGNELNAPTGPKSMRNGSGMRGGREKRMFGQMNKAMDRTHEGVLHRTRGAGRVNSHGNRGPPNGPRGGRNAMNNRAAGIAAGLAAGMPGMPGVPTGPGGMNGMNMNGQWMVPPEQTQQMDVYALLQQQNQMMQQLSQQLMMQQNGQGGRGHGKSLFDRVQGRGGRRGGHHQNGSHGQQSDSTNTQKGAEGEDSEMSQSKREPPNPETTVCKYNLACTNKECKFAHQSPAAPPGVSVDVNDICSYGPACKNRKCVGRHPSPAAKRAHQIEQDCKFFPNCTNPSCPFRHPSAPVCRNGGDCKVEGCKFTHLTTMCKYKPCTNRYCPFKHEDGQRGSFPDKVWTADTANEHVSERKFVDDNAPEEVVIPENVNAAGSAMDESIA